MQISRTIAAAAAVGAALALGGCSGVVAVNAPSYSQQYDDGELAYAGRSGELMTNVFGEPFAGADDRLVAVTTADMKGANLGSVIVFTPKPKKVLDAYHVVMLFNPVSWVSPYDICHDTAGYASPPSGGKVRLLSAFCFGEQMISTADGSVAGADGLEDPRFKALVRQVTFALFPAYDQKDPGHGSASTPF